MDGALRAQHREVQQLRDLLRDRKAREAHRCFVIDGPRAVDGAFDRAAMVHHLYVALDANAVASSVTERAIELGIAVSVLDRGVADRISDVRTSSGVFALCAMPDHDAAALDSGDLWVVLPSINDPGNLGTILRAAAAVGASGIVIGHGSVDPYNPKVVRASAGAVVGIPVVQGDAIEMLTQLGRRGVRRHLAVAPGGATPTTPLDEMHFDGPVAFVLGHETRGAPTDLAAAVDDAVAIPMMQGTESLNVAMATTVLLFEVARQRRSQVADHRPGVTQRPHEGAM